MMSVKLEGITDRHFIKRVISYVQNLLKASYDKRKFASMEAFINSVPEFRSIYRKEYSCKDIVYMSAYNLVYDFYDGSAIIYVDPNVYYPGTQVKLSQLCRLIDSGAIGLPGTYIYTNAFNEVQTSQYDWAELYKMGVF